MNKSVDNILEECITKGSRKSFFLFAGAGSGKTHSLVVLLNKIRDKWGQKFKIENRHVAVITYTNAATDEIISRLNYSPLFMSLQFIALFGMSFNHINLILKVLFKI